MHNYKENLIEKINQLPEKKKTLSVVLSAVLNAILLQKWLFKYNTFYLKTHKLWKNGDQSMFVCRALVRGRQIMLSGGAGCLLDTSLF